MAEGNIQIRPATKEDMAVVAQLIQELADFEKMPEGPKMGVKDLEYNGFVREPPSFRCKLAVDSSLSSDSVVGFALYFPIYSTWEGPAMMLEDIYVRPNARCKGVGKKLFEAVAQEAKSDGCSRLDFHVLEWNPACSFYESRGAVNLTKSEDWCYYRLTDLQKRTFGTE